MAKANDIPTEVNIRELSRDQRRARLVSIRERGYIAHRLSVPLPPDVHGEWVFNDPVERHRMEAMGFEVDTKYAVGKSLHNDGTGAPIVGDCIFMTCPKEIKEDIDWAESHKQRQLATKRQGFQEETHFEANAKSIGLEPVNTSNRELVKQDAIKDALLSETGA